MKTRIVKKKSSPHFEQLVKKFHWSMAMNSLQRILNKACHEPLRDLQLHCQKSLGSSLKKHIRQLSQGTDSSFGELKVPEPNIRYTPTANQHRKFKSSDFTSQIVNRKSEFRKIVESYALKQITAPLELTQDFQQEEKTKPKIEGQKMKIEENQKQKKENQKSKQLYLAIFIIVLFFGLLLI